MSVSAHGLSGAADLHTSSHQHHSVTVTAAPWHVWGQGIVFPQALLLGGSGCSGPSPLHLEFGLNGAVKSLFCTLTVTRVSCWCWWTSVSTWGGSPSSFIL